MENQRVIQLRTMPYEEYLKTPEWIEKRDQALERDGHRCRNCNSDKKLHVHHRTYARRGCEDLNDLTTLCQECHEHFHKRLRFSDSMYEERRISNPPREEVSTQGILQRSRQNMKKWEDYLIGLILRDTSIFPFVNGIVDEDDFIGEDTKTLYQLLKTILPTNQPIEQLIPSNLKSAMTRAAESVDEELTNAETQVKEAIQVATRLKRQRFVRLYEDTMFLLREATNAGDNEARRQLQQRILEIQRQLQSIDSAMHLHSQNTYL